MQTVTGFRGFPLEEVLVFPVSLVFVYLLLHWNFIHVFLPHDLHMFLLVICRITGFTFGPHLEFWRKASVFSFKIICVFS